MADLYLGLAALIGLSAVLFFVLKSLAQSWPLRMCDFVATLLVAGVVLYIVYVWDDVSLAEWLPCANLIVAGSWFLPATAALGGVVWRRVSGGKRRKVVFVTGLLMAALFATIHPLRGQPPKCHNEWDDEVCLQTSPATCSAASAATLLRSYGIATTEQEMAELCLTRRGTHWKGLYRGLKRKTAGTRWDVEIFECSLQELRAKAVDPLILQLELRAETNAAMDHFQRAGWIPGRAHSAVLFRIVGTSTVHIGDPAAGREIWALDDLKTLWHGQGLRLVPRE